MNIASVRQAVFTATLIALEIIGLCCRHTADLASRLLSVYLLLW